MKSRHPSSCRATARRHPTLFAAMRHSLAILIVGTLTACGGGEAPDSRPDPAYPIQASAPASTCTPRVVTVALPGDSTQFGVDGNTGGPALHNPGAELQTMMDLEFGVGAVVVTDVGVPGTVAAQVPQVHADVVVVNYGINDMREPGQTPEKFAIELGRSGATLIETQLPIVDRTWPEAAYVGAAKGVGLPVADVNAYVLSLPNWQSHYPDTAAGAGVHPDDSLYELVVDNVLAPAVAAQVAPLRCLP